MMDFYLSKAFQSPKGKQPGGPHLGGLGGEEGEGGSAQHPSSKKLAAAVVARQVAPGDLGEQVAEEEGSQQPPLSP